MFVANDIALDVRRTAVERIGIDLHKAFFQACALTSTAERHWRTTDAGIAALVARCGPQSHVVSRGLQSDVVCLRASVHVVDTRKTRIKAGSAKTRCAAAATVSGIYYPPPAIRDLRDATAVTWPDAGESETTDSRAAAAGGHGPARPVYAAGHAVARGADARRRNAACARCWRAHAVGAGAHDAHDRHRAQSASRFWSGVQRDAARRDRDHRPVPMGRTRAMRGWCSSAVAVGSGAVSPKLARRGCALIEFINFAARTRSALTWQSKRGC